MIHFFTGSNSFTLQAHLRDIVKKFVQEYGELNVERFDAEETEVKTLLDAVGSMPFLSPKKLVVIKGADTQTDLLEAIAAYDLPSSNEVIVVASKLDRRTALYKKLQKEPGFRSFDEVKPAELPAWLAGEAKARGGTLGRAEANFLVDRIGPNQMLLGHELDKLLTYNPQITRKAIEELCDPLPQSTIFQLIDAAFSNNGKRALELYEEQRRQRVEPLAILGMIGWQLHLLLTIKTAKDRSPDEIAGQAGINPFVVRKSLAIARKASFKDIKQLVARAVRLDVRLKSETIDADEALQHYLLTL